VLFAAMIIDYFASIFHASIAIIFAITLMLPLPA